MDRRSGVGATRARVRRALRHRWLPGEIPAAAVATILCILIPGALQAAAPLLDDDFERPEPAPWRPDPLPRMGSKPLRLVTEADGNRCLRADSDADFRAFGVRAADLAAADLDGDLALQDYPYLRWRWKVSAALDSADARVRERDDFAARLYLVFSSSRWNPFSVRTLIYVWDRHEPVGTVLPSTWARERARLVVLRNGDDPTHTWVTEARDALADYRQAFGQEPGPLKALVVATDTDQTGEAVTAWFDDVWLGSEPP